MNDNVVEAKRMPAVTDGYSAPTINRLGTLNDLTLGAFPGTGDAFGGQDFSCCFG